MENTVRSPEQIVPDKEDSRRTICQTRFLDVKGHPKLLRVVVEETGDCLVIVSTVRWRLPWREIAELRRLQQPRVFLHFMTLIELQQWVAFTLGEPKQLHLALER